MLAVYSVELGGVEWARITGRAISAAPETLAEQLVQPPILSIVPNNRSLFSPLSLSLAISFSPRGGVTRQGVVLTDLQSLLDCQ